VLTETVKVAIELKKEVNKGRCCTEKMQEKEFLISELFLVFYQALISLKRLKKEQ